MNTAQIILSQIKLLDRWALGVWGAKDLMNMGDGLKFKTSGMVRWKGYVYVQYDEGVDLYNVKFFRVRKSQVVMDKEVEGVFVDQLTEIIDEQVG